MSNVSTREGNPGRRRQGLTLLELVVVMAVLVAIAGILVPLLPNMLVTANNSTGAVNVTELTKAVQLYQESNAGYPDGYDSLIVSGGTALAPQVLASTWAGASTSLPVVSTWTADQITSLNAAGITTVYNMVDMTTTPTPSATFPGVATTTTGSGMDKTTTPTATTISTSTPLVTATPAYVQSVFGTGAVPTADLTNGTAYVVLGVGAECSIVGNHQCGIAEAPVRGTPGQGDDPSQTYGRFAVVYRVDAGGNAATLMGCACPGMMGLMASDGMQSKYYSTIHQ